MELVEQPGDYVPTILAKVKKTYMARTYRIPADWTNHLDFLEKLAQKSGKLLKGGEPDINTIAKMILNGNYKLKISLKGKHFSTLFQLLIFFDYHFNFNFFEYNFSFNSFSISNVRSFKNRAMHCIVLIMN